MQGSSYTYHYSQPADYRFCQDSVIAPKLIAADIAPMLTRADHPWSALDVCAGCGVMGFELLHALSSQSSMIDTFDFLDVQSEFRSHFEANLEITGRQAKWIDANYTILQTEPYAQRYDLIIANPPYFLRHEGSLSASALNNRARFFLDSDLTSLLKSVRHALKPQGCAYLLMKSGQTHGRDAFTSARVELFNCHVERLADVRGTDLVKITRDATP